MRHTGALLGILMMIVFAAAAFGQPVGAGVNIGELPFGQVFPTVGSAGVASTIVDLTQPASAAGSLTSATVRWLVTNACASAFKIKILRPLTTQFGTYTVVAERGPFSTPAFGGDLTVALSPAIAVNAGDLLAVTQLNAGLSNCGSVALSTSTPGHSAIVLTSDVQTGTVVGGNFLRGSQLNARASSGLPALVGIVPAVGSVQGGFGSAFRTAVQILSGGTTAQTIAGRLVFHPANASASASDPGVDFSLVGRQTVAFEDLVASLNATGLGTLDILSSPGSAIPLLTVRVFNDNGTAGTQGFVEPVVKPRDAATTNAQVFLSAPHDLANFRMNIGVRTFEQGATLLVLYLSKDGVSIAPIPAKTYAPNWFEQVSLQVFVNGNPPQADAIIVVSPTAGSAVVYGSTTDNRTNDSFVALATPP